MSCTGVIITRGRVPKEYVEYIDTIHSTYANFYLSSTVSGCTALEYTNIYQYIYCSRQRWVCCAAAVLLLCCLIFLEYFSCRADDAHGDDSQKIERRMLAICNWSMHVCLVGFPSRQLNPPPCFPTANQHITISHLYVAPLTSSAQPSGFSPHLRSAVSKERV